MNIGNNAKIKSILKSKQKFVIYNIISNKAMDVDYSSESQSVIAWHSNFKKNQYFRFQIDSSHSDEGISIFGYFIPIANENKILSLLVNDSNKENAIFAISMNEKGLICIKWIQNKIPMFTLSKGVENDIFKFDRSLKAEYQWLFIRKEEYKFNDKQVIIQLLPEKTYALNSKTGERWLRKEIFDIYDKSKHIYKARCNSDNLYSFLQLNGEYYITARNQMLIFSPFNNAASQWTIINNVLDIDIYYLLSMEKFYFLTDKTDSFMNISPPKLNLGNQSFAITIVEESENNSQINLDENVSINDDQGQRINPIQSSFQAAGVKIAYNQMNNQKNISINSNQQTNTIQIPNNNSMNSNNNYQNNRFNGQINKFDNIQNNNFKQVQNQFPQQQQQQMNDNQNLNMSMQSYNYKQKDGSYTLDNFKQSTQSEQINVVPKNVINQKKKCKLYNKGSFKFLMVSENDVIDAPNENAATYFIIEYLQQDQISITFNRYYLSTLNEQSPINPIRMLDSSTGNKIDFSFKLELQEDNSYTLKKNHGFLQVIGRKLFFSQLKQNDYNKFVLLF